MIRSCVGAVVALALAADAGVIVRAARQTPIARQSFKATTTAILVDVVVRDRKGHPVTNLSAGDFEIFEDGAPQKVDTFTQVSRGGGIGVGVAWKDTSTTVDAHGRPSSSSIPPDTIHEDGTTALVFDHLSSESLRLAQRATLRYLPPAGETSAKIAVFATDPGVRIVQRYTTDRSLVRQAVERVLPAGTDAEEQKVERSDQLISRRRELNAENESGTGVTGGAAVARNAQNASQRDIELQLIRTELDMLRSENTLDRAHKGYNTAEALLAVVQTLAQFPGRKTVVFFSEGLPVSPAMSARLDWVIDAANRANITAYAIDAHGLRAKSTLTGGRTEIDVFAEERFAQLSSGTDRTDQPMTMAFERVEDTMKLDSRTGLARLAQETGGFLVEGSNDLTSAFRRIDEDNQFHYLLTYSPVTGALDGKFHAIQVKVGRPGVQVFARKGYRAVGAPHSIDTGEYEAPALALLDRGPVPNAFPMHAAAFSFPEPSRPGLTPVLVHVATDSLQFNVDRDRLTYSSQAAVVVRIRDGKGREVEKLSQQYLLAGDAKDIEAAKQGHILFYREVVLPPGVYNVESVVFDATAQKGSARIASLTVPADEAVTFAMSSLVLVTRVEDVAEAARPRHPEDAPLYVGHALLYPNLGEPIRRSATGELPFYFTLYGDLRTVTAAAQLLRNGQPLAEAPVQLQTVAGRRLQHVGRLPIASLPPGTYELRIKVTDGRREVSRTAYFTLLD